MNAKQISIEYEKMMKSISKIRSELFDCVEIPHLQHYYEGGDQALTFSTDLLLIREAEKYISQNLCISYSINITNKVNQCIEKLLKIKMIFEDMNANILKQYKSYTEKLSLSEKEKESLQNTIVVQNNVIEEYYYSKPNCY